MKIFLMVRSMASIFMLLLAEKLFAGMNLARFFPLFVHFDMELNFFSLLFSCGCVHRCIFYE